MNVTVTWDNVTLGSLVSNGSVYYNWSSGFVLNIVRLGTNASIEWNMGDGSPLVYYQLAPAYYDNSPGTRLKYIKVESQYLAQEINRTGAAYV